jgi:hypothetical protein
MRRRAGGVSEAYVIPMGEHLLHRCGVSFDEFVQRLLTLLDHSVKIFCGTYLEPPFPLDILRSSYVIHPSA